MLDGFPVDQVGVGSGWALVAAFVWMIYTGRLIPKTVFERELGQIKEAIGRAEHDANEWRTEGRIKDQQILEKDLQLRHLEAVGQNVLKILGVFERWIRGVPEENDPA